MHNMIVEERRIQNPEIPCAAEWMEANVASLDHGRAGRNGDAVTATLFGHNESIELLGGDISQAMFDRVATLSASMIDDQEHHQLQRDIMQHLWAQRHQNDICQF
jgi:hypothetical protein